MPRAKAKGKAGQPTKFTQAIADKLCELIMSGLSVHKICSMPSMPPRSTVNTWLTKDEKFSYQYANALQFRTHLKAEERHELIESAFTDIQNLKEGVNSNVWVTLVKEQVRAIEWDAERLAAKRYKPKDTEHDKGEAQPLTISFNVSDPVSKVKTTNAKT